MQSPQHRAWARDAFVWVALTSAIVVPIAASAMSPLLAWRDPIYIAGGLAGVVAMTLLLVQPILAGAYLTGLPKQISRRMHRLVGGVLVGMVMLHVLALWITSPPDVIDALLFRSPTPFSLWGVIAMWAVMASALLAALRWRLHMRPPSWRLAHKVLAVVIVLSTILHALLIQGTMETISKTVLCLLLFAATARVLIDLRRSRLRRP